jgi:hypothetical protein
LFVDFGVDVMGVNWLSGMILTGTFIGVCVAGEEHRQRALIATKVLYVAENFAPCCCSSPTRGRETMGAGFGRLTDSIVCGFWCGRNGRNWLSGMIPTDTFIGACVAGEKTPATGIDNW